MSNDNFLGGFNFDSTPFLQAMQSGMELMGQTWQNLSTNKAVPFPTASLDVDELDKRIEELKHVENWLTMNLSMLKNTIQGFELQRHSIASFKDLMQTVSDQHKDTPSLDEVLSNFSKTASTSADASTQEQATSEPLASASIDSDTIGEAVESATANVQATGEALQQAGQAWWGLMQNQLENLLSIQAERVSQAEQAIATATSAASTPEEAPSPKSQRTTPTQLKRASKPAAKKVTASANPNVAPSKTLVKKVAARKTSASPATNPTAKPATKRSASKTSASAKTTSASKTSTTGTSTRATATKRAATKKTSSSSTTKTS